MVSVLNPSVLKNRRLRWSHLETHVVPREESDGAFDVEHLCER